MTAVVLLGCGGIGRRHLEALLRLPPPAEIYIVEPDPERLQLAAQTAKAAADSRPVGRLHYLSGCDGLPEAVEVGVVATTAATRRSAIESLLGRCRPRFLILEKVLFQRPEDYAAVGRLLERAGTRAWVNCPRRLWPLYRELAAEIAPCPELLLRVVGPASLGIGSNAIHLLDLLAFLTGSAEIAVEAGGLQLLPGGSRRGTLEFLGTLTARTPAGGSLICSTLERGERPLRLDLDFHERSLRYEEGRARGWAATAAEGWRWQAFEAQPLLQSRLTDQVVRTLAQTGDCALPGFAESSRLHLALLTALSDRLAELGIDSREGVPIT